MPPIGRPGPNEAKLERVPVHELSSNLCAPNGCAEPLHCGNLAPAMIRDHNCDQEGEVFVIRIKRTGNGACRIQPLTGDLRLHLSCLQKYLAYLSQGLDAGQSQVQADGRHAPNMTAPLGSKFSGAVKASEFRVFAPSPAFLSQENYRHTQKRSAPGSDTEMDDQPSDDDNTKKSRSHWTASGNLIALHLDQVLQFFKERFDIIGQASCRILLRLLIEAIWTKPQEKSLFDGSSRKDRNANYFEEPEASTQDAPPFWPSDRKYQGSYRLPKRERLDILSQLFALPLIQPDQTKNILDSQPHGRGYDSWRRLLEDAVDRNLRSQGKALPADNNNHGRNLARLKALKELIRVAGEVEGRVRRETDFTLPIPYEAIPREIWPPSFKARKSEKRARPITNPSRTMKGNRDNSLVAGFSQASVGDSDKNWEATSSTGDTTCDSCSIEGQEAARFALPPNTLTTNMSPLRPYHADRQSANSSFDSSLTTAFHDAMDISTYHAYSANSHNETNAHVVGHDIMSTNTYNMTPGILQPNLSHAGPSSEACISSAQSSYGGPLQPSTSSQNIDQADSVFSQHATFGPRIRRAASVGEANGIPIQFVDGARYKDDQTIIDRIPQGLRFTSERYDPVLGPHHFDATIPTPELCSPHPSSDYATHVSPHVQNHSAFPINMYPNMTNPPVEFSHGFFPNGAPRGQTRQMRYS